MHTVWRDVAFRDSFLCNILFRCNVPLLKCALGPLSGSRVERNVCLHSFV